MLLIPMIISIYLRLKQMQAMMEDPEKYLKALEDNNGIPNNAIMAIFPHHSFSYIASLSFDSK